MSGVEIFTIENTDENILQIIGAIGIGLTVAMEAEVLSPENYSAVRAWVRAEEQRINGRLGRPVAKRADPLEAFKRSKHWPFWSTLAPEQEVRWTQTKHMTYFVVTGEIHDQPPRDDEDANRHDRGRSVSGWVKLRRHTGKSFWSHIAHVRPHLPPVVSLSGDGREDDNVAS